MFVLVHGGWCYASVAERLRAAGHRVLAPSLLGCGEPFPGMAAADTRLEIAQTPARPSPR